MYIHELQLTVWMTLLSQGLVSLIMLAEIAYAFDILGPGTRSSVDNRQGNDTFLLFGIAHSPLFALGVACAVMGGLIRVWSYRTMGAHFTYQLSVLDDHKLVTTGPYAYVRHPGYTTLLLVMFGIFACELSAGSWWTGMNVSHSALGKGITLCSWSAAIFNTVIVSRALAEDRMMRKRFGKQWEAWKEAVPSMLIPGVL